MKIYIVIVLAIFGIVYNGNCQLIVSDPDAEINLHVQTAMQMALKALSERAQQLAEDQAKKTTEHMVEDYAIDYLQNLATINKIISLLGGMVCAQSGLQQSMSGGYSSCFFSFRYNVAIMKVSMATDFVSLALSARKITSGERIKTLNDVVSRLQEANLEMQKLMGEINIQEKLNKAVAHAKKRASTNYINRSGRTSITFLR